MLHAFHSGLSLAEEVWPFDKFCRYGAEVLVNPIPHRHVDMTILNSTYLYEFYKNGFNSHVQNNVIKAKHPDRFIVRLVRPADEEAGVDLLRRMVASTRSRGSSLHAEWRNGRAAGASTTRGPINTWRWPKNWASRTSTHKGPTVYPLSADAFDVRDVDYAATDFPELNFIVEHVGLPRLDDFADRHQESNVYAGLSVAMAFVHLRPRYFDEIMANLLFCSALTNCALAATTRSGRPSG
jgi:predicted TIM-barrel fold metal-dependent hydrolase